MTANKKKMTNKELLQYKVIEQSEKAKEVFNKLLKEKKLKVLKTFENQYGELFVIMRNGQFDYGQIILITGDEFGWEIYQHLGGNVCLPAPERTMSDGVSWFCAETFLLSPEEVKEI